MTLIHQLSLVVCLTSLACNAGGEAKPAEAKPAEAKPAEAKSVEAKPAEAKSVEAEVPDAAAMKEHFTQAIAVRDAVIAGNMEGITTPAKWLADQTSYASMPDPWKAQLQDMRNAAQLVVEGTDLEAKARAAAQLAVACGTCHQALGQSPQWTSTSDDVAASGRSAHMAKHLQAAEQLWQGLAGPSEAAWQAGVLTLGEVPLAPDGLEDDASPDDAVAALATKVHELGREGATVADATGRAELYGEFLSTCAACHQALASARAQVAAPSP